MKTTNEIKRITSCSVLITIILTLGSTSPQRAHTSSGENNPTAVWAAAVTHGDVDAERLAKSLGVPMDRLAALELAKYLHDPDENVRVVAANAMGAFVGIPEVVDTLIAALGDWSPVARAAIVQSLGKLGDARALKPLLRLLQWDLPEVKREAAAALGEIGNTVAVTALIKALKDWDAGVRREACRALGNLGDRSAIEAVWPLLFDGNNLVRAEAVLAVAKLKADGACAALQKLVGDWTTEVRRRAAEGIGLLECKEAGKDVIRLLSDASPDVRAATARALGRLKDAAYIDLLLKISHDWIPEVRAAVAEALGNYGPKKRIEEALTAYFSDPDAGVRASATLSAGKIGLTSASGHLIRLLRDWEPEVRAAAAKGLGMLKDRKAVKPLEIALLSDASALVRRNAAWSLGQIGDETALPALEKATQDWNAAVGKEANKAINLLKGGNE